MTKQSSMFLVLSANLAVMSLVVIFNLISVGGYLAYLHPLLILFGVMVSVPIILEKLKAGAGSELLPAASRRQDALKS